MAEITLFLVIEDSKHMGGGTLYEKKIDTPFVPREEDRIELWGDEFERGAVMGHVQYPYWQADGSVCVQLQHWCEDPNEVMEQVVGYRPGASNPIRAWRSDDEGYSLAATLLATGWRVYGS